MPGACIQPPVNKHHAVNPAVYIMVCNENERACYYIYSDGIGEVKGQTDGGKKGPNLLHFSKLTYAEIIDKELN